MRRLIIVAICLVAASARADDLEQARAHFKRAEEAFRAGAYDRAIEEYQAAYAIVPRPGLLYNLGAAYRRKAESTGALDDRKRALDHYRRYLEADPAGKAVAEARSYIAELEREIASVETAAPASEPASLPVAPPPPQPPVAPPPAPVPDAPPARVEAPSAPTSPARIAGMATAAAGVVLVGTGVYFGLRAISIAKDVDALSGRWDHDLYESGQAAQRNALICVGAGTAALAGGALLYFLAGAPADVVVTTSSVGVSVRF